MAGGELFGTIEENEAGCFYFPEFVGKAFLFPHAALGRETEQHGLESALFDARDELLEERCFSRADAADDAGAPLLGFEALEQRFPVHSGGKMEEEVFKFGSGEWIFVVWHVVRVACDAVVWEEKVAADANTFCLYSAPMGLGFVFALGAGVEMTAIAGDVFCGGGFFAAGSSK